MKALFILPGELAAKIDYNADHCFITLRASITLLERECAEMTDMEIAVACLQATVSDRAIFPCENPKLDLPPRGAFADWEFSATFKALIPPLLDWQGVAEDFTHSLHDDDLVSFERCRERLILRIQSQINPPLPEAYLQSRPTPVDAIDIWSRELALAALGDMSYPGFERNRPREERINRAIDWILKNALTKAQQRESTLSDS